MYRWFIACVATALLVSASSALAADQVTIVSGLSRGAIYVPDTWLPLWVDVRNDSDRDIAGEVHVVPLDVSVPEFRATAQVAAHSRARIELWAYLSGKHKAGESAGLVTVHDGNGAQLARSEFAAAPALPNVTWSANGQANSGLVITLLGATVPQQDEYLMQGPADALGYIGDRRAISVSVTALDAPRSASFYRGVYCMGIVGLKPDTLDAAQRRAIMEYVSTGGVLVLSSPDLALLRGSWLEPYLPVTLVGMREMKEILPQGEATPRKFTGYFRCAEALPGEGTIVLRDKQYVYAAYRSLGLGRIAFTSFPAGALDPKDSPNADLWRVLLNYDRGAIGFAGSQLQRNYGREMEPMLGRHAASWFAAATVVGVFVLLIIAAHGFWRGPARPRAFAVSLAAAVVFAIVFAVMASLRQETDPVQQARLTVSDVWEDGMVTEELAALSGPPEKATRVAVEENVTVRPVLFRTDRPKIWQLPTRVDDIPVQPGQVSLVTLSQRTRTDKGVMAVGRFTDRGLLVEVNNAVASELTDGQLVWNRRRLVLPRMADGKSSFVLNAGDVRPVDDFTSATGVASQDQKHKGEILKAVLSGGDSMNDAHLPPPQVVAWSPVAMEASHVQSVQLDRDVSQNLVRFPLRLARGTPGERVRIDGVFNTFRSGESRGMPYDFGKSEFIPTTMEGAWSLCVAPPAEVGAIRPIKARVHLILNTPQHNVTLSRGRAPVAGGKKTAVAGAVVGQWNSSGGTAREVAFDIEPGEYDAQGRLWLVLEVKSSGSAGSLGVPPSWSIAKMDVDIEGEVVGDKSR